MRSRRSIYGKTRERGAIVLFLVIMIALMSLSIHRFLPSREPSYHRHRQRTIEELNALSFALRDYYFDKKSFPVAEGSSSITNSAFVFTFFNPGINPTTSNPYTGGANKEQWYNKEDGSWTYRDTALCETSSSTDDYWKFWSTGPNFTNDDAASDDIVRTETANLVATARTRRLLALIRQAATYYTVTLSSGTWSGPTYRRGSGSSYTPASGCSLGPEFDTDGWGNSFVVDTTNSRVYSIGANETDNSGGSDDILW